MKSWFSIYVIVLVCKFVFGFQKTQCTIHKLFTQEKQDHHLLLLQENINIIFSQPQKVSESRLLNITSSRAEELEITNLPEEMLIYSGKFRKFKFNFEDSELKELAYDVRDLYARDKIALFFISAYFIRACELLEKQQTPAHQITKIIKRKIKSLMNMTSIETFRKQKYGEHSKLRFQPEYWFEIQNQVVEMTPKKYMLHDENKDEQIEQIIMQMVKSAEKHYSLFQNLSTVICVDNSGLNHHINYKIRSREQKAQMKRVKQKLLRGYFKPHADRCLNTFLNIGWKRKLEQNGFQQLLNKVYQQLKQVEFNVKDMLRSKCMFRSIHQIRQASLSLIEQVNRMKGQGIDIKIIEFEYRLDKITCDVIIVVQIDELLCEMQLSLDFDQYLFQISHKMYEMSRSKVFSPIVQLFDWFLNIAPEFLSKIGSFVDNTPLKHNQTITKASQAKKQRLIRQYQLLNNFFHITSLPVLRMDKKQYQHEIEEQINKYRIEILKTFIPDI